VEQFVTDLKLLVRDCSFKEPDEMIRDRIVFGTNSRKIREKLINEEILYSVLVKKIYNGLIEEPREMIEKGHKIKRMFCKAEKCKTNRKKLI